MDNENAGEELVLEKNFFVERILLADSATGYTDEGSRVTGCAWALGPGLHL